jgi:predicted PurR-regulated permease PerM
MLVSSRRLEGTLGIVALSFLAIGCFLVLRPFVSALMWAVILTFSTWPVYAWLERRLGGRRSLAALAMTVLLATAFVLPLVLVGTSLADDARVLGETVRGALADGVPPLPPWLAELPAVGPELDRVWRRIATNTGTLLELLRPYMTGIRDVALAGGITVGRGLLELTLSVAATFFLYRDGLYAAEQLHLLGHRLAGERGRRLLLVASATIRSVVYGIIGTAVAQGLLAAIGFWIAGLAQPLLLGILVFFLALVPMGPPLVWAPAGIWLLYSGHYASGIFILVWGALVVSGVDNFLKPYLISRGSALPFLLVFLGVVGGALAFGFLGIFLGPTLLAVGYALLREWAMAGVPSAAAEAAPRTDA